MIPDTPCPHCHLAVLESGYEPGATWAECPECHWQCAVPDHDPDGLRMLIEEEMTRSNRRQVAKSDRIQ